MQYTAFVPARSGSKRLPGKNIKLLASKPLVVWSLEAFINSSKVNEVIFSTDSMEYWDIVQKYITSNKLILDFRSPSDAADKIKIIDYLKNKNKKIFGNKIGAFILGLPTTPLRTTPDINRAIKLYETYNKPVFSATEYSFPISFAFTKNENKWLSVFEKNPMIEGNTRSQDQKKTYHPNGAIYIRPINDLNSKKLKTLYDDAIPLIMDRFNSIDIDEKLDFLIAEKLITEKL